MTVIHYTNSKGQQVEIATMLHPHLLNARDKLVRDGDPKRQPEIKAMTARLAVLDAEYAESINEANGDNPRIHLGANNPPEERKPKAEKAAPQGWNAIVANMDDWLMEARNWADGVKVETETQAEKVESLIGELRDAGAAAEAERVKEKKPLDDKIKAIQDRYNPYIAPLTNKTVKGKIPLAIDALQKTLKPYLDKQKADKEAAALKALQDAQAAADAAAAALRSVDESDLVGREEVNALLDAADDAARVAKQAERATTSGTGLTRFYEPVMIDKKAAVFHYMNQDPQRFLDLAMEMAKIDVRAGKRQIPGFDVQERTRVNA